MSAIDFRIFFSSSADLRIGIGSNVKTPNDQGQLISGYNLDNYLSIISTSLVSQYPRPSIGYSVVLPGNYLLYTKNRLRENVLVPPQLTFKATDPILNDASYIEVYVLEDPVNPRFTFGDGLGRPAPYTLFTVMYAPPGTYNIEDPNVDEIGKTFDSLSPNINFLLTSGSKAARLFRETLRQIFDINVAPSR